MGTKTDAAPAQPASPLPKGDPLAPQPPPQPGASPLPKGDPLNPNGPNGPGPGAAPQAPQGNPPASPPPDDRPAADRGQDGEGPAPADLPSGFAAAAKQFRLGGHALLGKIAETAGLPEPVRSAAHDIAFAVNTGLAPAAVQGLQKIGPEALGRLVDEVIEEKLDQAGVTALLRERFPEPQKRIVA
jgi:hypothetical protein